MKEFILDDHTTFYYKILDVNDRLLAQIMRKDEFQLMGKYEICLQEKYFGGFFGANEKSFIKASNWCKWRLNAIKNQELKIEL